MKHAMPDHFGASTPGLVLVGQWGHVYRIVPGGYYVTLGFDSQRAKPRVTSSAARETSSDSRSLREQIRETAATLDKLPTEVRQALSYRTSMRNRHRLVNDDGSFNNGKVWTGYSGSSRDGYSGSSRDDGRPYISRPGNITEYF